MVERAILTILDDVTLLTTYRYIDHCLAINPLSVSPHVMIQAYLPQIRFGAFCQSCSWRGESGGFTIYCGVYDWWLRHWLPLWRDANTDFFYIVHIFLSIQVVGMVSGNYLFKEPLKEYWEEQDSLKSSPAPNGGPTSVASSNAK